MKPVKVKGEGKKTARAPKRFLQAGEEAGSGLSFPMIFWSAELQARLSLKGPLFVFSPARALLLL